MDPLRIIRKACEGWHDRLVSVSTAGGTELPTDAVFVAAPFRAASDLPASLCEVNEAGLAITDVDGRTSRPGV